MKVKHNILVGLLLLVVFIQQPPLNVRAEDVVSTDKTTSAEKPVELKTVAALVDTVKVVQIKIDSVQTKVRSKIAVIEDQQKLIRDQVHLIEELSKH